MFTLFSQFSLWLLGCFVAGAAAGRLAPGVEREKGAAAWLIWAGLAFSAAMVAALLQVFAGRAALLLESGIVAFAAFLIGCMAGTLMRGGSLRDHKGWALGVLPAALLWLGANHFAGPDLEKKLERSLAAALERSGAQVGSIAVEGRDAKIVAEGVVSPALVESVSGLRKIELAGAAQAPVTQAPVAQPPVAQTPSAATLGVGATTPPQPGPGDEKAGAAETPAPAPSAAPAVEPERRRMADPERARAILAALPPDGGLDAASCETALAAALALENIEFRRASATIRRVSSPLMDRLAGLLQRCPGAKFEVVDFAAAGEGRALAQRRAEAVVSFLERWGVARGRLSGAGHETPAEPGRAGGGRLEFVAK